MQAMNTIASKPEHRQSPERDTPSRFSRNNYVALPGPNSGNRKGAGAPKGNRNARKHGRYMPSARRAAPEGARALRPVAGYGESDLVMVAAGVRPERA